VLNVVLSEESYQALIAAEKAVHYGYVMASLNEV
jgi:hypothetical protein